MNDRAVVLGRVEGIEEEGSLAGIAILTLSSYPPTNHFPSAGGGSRDGGLVNAIAGVGHGKGKLGSEQDAVVEGGGGDRRGAGQDLGSDHKVIPVFGNGHGVPGEVANGGTGRCVVGGVGSGWEERACGGGVAMDSIADIGLLWRVARREFSSDGHAVRFDEG